MKKQQTLGLLLGTTCLATIAMTQVSRPGDAPTQQPALGGQQNADSLMKVQQRLHQAVTSEVRAGAMKHDVKINEAEVLISLLGDHGIVAGAPSQSGSGSSSNARKPGETSTTGTSTTGTGRDQGQPGGATVAPTQTQTGASENILGVVLLSRGLAPNSGATLPGTERTPGATGGQSGTDADAGQKPQNRTEGAAGTDATGANKSGSNELVAFEVRRSQQGQQIELVDESGRVAMQVQLLGAANDSSRRTREASAPREDREDATVGGGDPLAREPQGTNRPGTGNNPQRDMNQDGSAEWSVVYASVVHQLCSKHHGAKK